MWFECGKFAQRGFTEWLSARMWLPFTAVIVLKCCLLWASVLTRGRSCYPDRSWMASIVGMKTEMQPAANSQDADSNAKKPRWATGAAFEAAAYQWLIHQPCWHCWLNFFVYLFFFFLLLVVRKGRFSQPVDAVERILRNTIFWNHHHSIHACSTGNYCLAWRPSGRPSLSWWSARGWAPQWPLRSLLSALGRVLSRPCSMQPTILTS